MGISRSISKKIALVCMLLTFWSVIAVVAHQHSSTTEASTCSICVAAHSASPKINANPLKATFIAVSTIKAQPVSAKQRLVIFALTVRPPPSV
jgi:hypothetical protein